MAVLLAGTVTLFSGCTTGKTEDKKSEMSKEKLCTHLTVYFDEKPVTLKECEGYKIEYYDGHYASNLYYEVKKDSKMVLEGTTLNYNVTEVLHSEVDNLIESDELKKVR